MNGVQTLGKLEVPLIVRLGQRQMTVGDVVGLAPGVIIELPKNADEELDLLVNDKQIGYGRAVKVGENFGIRITFLGDVRMRAAAIVSSEAGGDGDNMDELAESLLAGQL
ncbi:MAG: FliM/FliN family flagellar motor switch protein [Phycisphaeraceae bacterium]|nr:FliM/FliN family flagellar motor switch protein [Phycisphaeraceae bacterium]MCW5755487.1 FliM/FliN family flagellar motor switch protein [Phycisphaeraceae bacterium]